ISLSAEPGKRANVRAVPTSDCDVLVVGAGVSGLTTAICLAEAGGRGGIRTAAPPGETTPPAARARWAPHPVAHTPRAAPGRRRAAPGPGAAGGGREPGALRRESAAAPAPGVRIAPGGKAPRGPPPRGPPPRAPTAAPPPLPDWQRELGAVPCPAGDLPAGF